jgi:chromate transporter
MPVRPASTVRDVCLYFLRLGTTGFGGPVALVGYMQRDLVEDRRWFTPEEYREGLALAQLAPGPLAAQLAMYLGWVKGRSAGAALVGAAFVLPSFAMVIAIAVGYLRFGGLPWMQGAFYGIGAAVIAIIARSAVKLTRLTLAGDLLLWTLFGIAALVTAWTESEIVWVFVGAGFVVLLARGAPFGPTPRTAVALAFLPSGLLAGLAGPPASAATLGRIALYFTEAGAFVFGSGLAIVPFLHAGVVQEYGWLDERQFLDAVAVAMITPGPVVITVGFIGYLVAGVAGAVVASLATFLPCYVFTVLPAPHFRRLSQNRAIKAFVDGVTAAATGAIAGAAVVLGRRALVDAPTVAIAAGALLVLTRVRRVPEPVVIVAAGLLGVLLAGPAGAAAQASPPRVVFVCEHGSAKSLVAASYFDRMAKERGLAVRALSRGTAPDAAVPPAVLELLAADGFDAAGFKPQALSAHDLEAAVRVVAIGVDIGGLASGSSTPVERWDDVPPFSQGYPKARAVMVARIESLLRALAPAPAGLDTARIETLTGAKGALDEKEGVFRVSVPRTDLTVSAAGVRITPPLGLTSWAAFKRASAHAMVMGDLVLLEDQVNPVMSVALDEGLEVTALHNHFFWDTPKVMFMHIGGSGEETALASAVGRVFGRIKATSGGKGEVPRADIDPARTTLQPARIEAILGHPGALASGVYRVTIGRKARMHGEDVGAAMGVNTWAAFAGSDELAVVDGDFAMRESELQGVLRALRRGGINVVAIHHHMAGEEPRILFLHYWGVGPTEGLARALRSALDQTRHE